MEMRWRRSPRFKGFDYATPGAYFITSCSHLRRKIFATFNDGVRSLTPLGQLIDTQWLELERDFKTVGLDSYVVMPNHFHGIIFLSPLDGLASRAEVSISTCIGRFKGEVTRRERRMRRNRSFNAWQPNFHDRVIRNERELDAIRAYIASNPARWQFDIENATGKPDKAELDFWSEFGESS